MSELHPGLAVALQRLSARARRVAAARSLALALAAVAASWAALVVLDNRGVVGPGWGLAWALATLVAAGVAARARAGAWGALGDARLHAQRVEGLRPALRGRLLVAVDHARRPMGSAVLVERMAGAIAPEVASVSGAEAWPAAGLARDGGLAAAAVLALALGAWLPRGPIEVLARAFAPTPPPEIEDATSEAGPRARVGDITLRYLYPTYTRLEPTEVTNGSGEVRAPPGTRVEVRATAVGPVASASLVAGTETLPAEVVGGRSLRGGFVVGAEGSWKWILDGVPSVDFRVIPDPDLPPDVTLRLPRSGAEFPAGSAVAIEAAIRDDFGVTSTLLEVVAGPRRREIALRTPLDAPRALDLAAATALGDLGLGAGDRAVLRVGAYDNDEVSGRKLGWSAPVTITVLGTLGEALRDAEDFRRFRDALVPVLADFVVEPSPPAGGAAGAMPGWGARADARYAAFDDLVDARLQGSPPIGLLATVLEGVGGARRRLVAFARGLGDHPALVGADEATLADLQARHLRAVEESIYALDLRVRAAAAARVQEHVEILAGEADELRRDGGRMSSGEMRSALRPLSARWTDLQDDARELGESALGDTVIGASPTVEALLREIDRALDGRATEEGRALVQRLADQLTDLYASVQDIRAREEQQQQQSSALGDLVERLEELQREQAELRAGVEAARRGAQAAGPDPAAAWKEVGRRADAAASILADGRRELRALGADRNAAGAWRDAREAAIGLRAAADARALESAMDRAYRAERMAQAAERRAQDRARRAEDEAEAKALGVAAAEFRAARKQAAGALEILEEMVLRAGSATPGLAETLRSRAAAQSRLAEEIAGAARDADAVAGQIPVPTPGLREGAEEARGRSGEAVEHLEEARALDAEGAQAGAEDGLRRALEALQQARQDLQELREGGRKGAGQEQRRAGDSREGTGNADWLATGEQDVIPAPEEFASPEEYRRALMEGMRGHVPEAYKATSRRYYEELVRQ